DHSEVVEGDGRGLGLFRAGGREPGGGRLAGNGDRLAQGRPGLSVPAHPALILLTGAAQSAVPVSVLGLWGQVDRLVTTGSETAVDLGDEFTAQQQFLAGLVAGYHVEFDVVVVVAVSEQTRVLPTLRQWCLEPCLDGEVSLGGGLEDEVLRRGGIV